MKKLVAIIFIALIANYAWQDLQLRDRLGLGVDGSGSTLSTAYEQRQSNIQVNGAGVVVKILPDDNRGSRHQRFILRLDSGQTVLVAHNIDLAPRIDTLRTGDTVAFFGEYEWNAEGGVIHWTHHDPRGKHVNGWLRHGEKIYR
jgi:hypothetical protein